MTTAKAIAMEGTPVEIGAAVFINLCIPAVQQAQTQLQATPNQLAQLYCGFLQACMGAMTNDFGQEQAAAIGQTMIDAFRSVDMGQDAAKH